MHLEAREEPLLACGAAQAVRAVAWRAERSRARPRLALILIETPDAASERQAARRTRCRARRTRCTTRTTRLSIEWRACNRPWRATCSWGVYALGEVGIVKLMLVGGQVDGRGRGRAQRCRRAGAGRVCGLRVRWRDKLVS